MHVLVLRLLLPCALEGVAVSMWQKLAALLGVRDDQVDDALVDEQRCQRQLTRRGLLLASAAAVGGALLPKRAWSLPSAPEFPTWETIELTLAGHVYIFERGDLVFMGESGELVGGKFTGGPIAFAVADGHESALEISARCAHASTSTGFAATMKLRSNSAATLKRAGRITRARRVATRGRNRGGRLDHSLVAQRKAVGMTAAFPLGIPTTYRGVRMRSRLEARWAAFFDALGWPWRYELIDLYGYIPDFVIAWTPHVVVEVKPSLSVEALLKHRRKLERSQWAGEAMIVGAEPFEIDAANAILGAYGERGDGGSWEWSHARVFRCLSCGQVSVLADAGSWRCRACGVGDGNGHVGFERIARAWADSGNRVQWRPE